MRFLNGWGKRNKTSAATAKERLRIVVAQQRDDDGKLELLVIEQLRYEILSVVRKYTTGILITREEE